MIKQSSKDFKDFNEGLALRVLGMQKVEHPSLFAPAWRTLVEQKKNKKFTQKVIFLYT